MGLPVKIVDLIKQRVVESMRFEYKEDWNPEPIMHSITAFANDFDNLGGGYTAGRIFLSGSIWQTTDTASSRSGRACKLHPRRNAHCPRRS